MFYRFKSKFATQDRLEAFIVGIPGTEKKPIIPGLKNYEGKFRICTDEEPFSGVVIYQAPEYNNKVGISLRFHPGKENEVIPDIWGVGDHLICSQVFRDVVQSVDRFEHEFIPIELLDDNEKIITTPEQYYWFNARRFVRIKTGDDKIAGLPFAPTPDEALFLKRALQEEKIERILSELPLWRYYAEDTARARNHFSHQILYLSLEMVNQLREAGVTGMATFSLPWGAGEESLVKVECVKEE